METKLTLKLDRSVIQSAKKYAETRHKSLSKLVEEYFSNLTGNTSPKSRFSPLVEELSGVISAKDADALDYAAYLEQKYE